MAETPHTFLWVIEKTPLFCSNLVFNSEFYDILNLVKIVAKNKNHSWSLDGRFAGPIIPQDTVFSLREGDTFTQKVTDTQMSFSCLNKQMFCSKVHVLYSVEIKGKTFAVCADHYRKL